MNKDNTAPTKNTDCHPQISAIFGAKIKSITTPIFPAPASPKTTP